MPDQGWGGRKRGREEWEDEKEGGVDGVGCERPLRVNPSSWFSFLC